MLSHITPLVWMMFTALIPCSSSLITLDIKEVACGILSIILDFFLISSNY